jgi:hypothetical protein
VLQNEKTWGITNKLSPLHHYNSEKKTVPTYSTVTH